MMSDAPNSGITQSRLDELYARLPQQDVEEFYASYSQWTLQRRIVALQNAISSLRRQIVANSELLQEAQPSAVALATLARLQANGVSDIELLDRMLECGEEWLDATMQRLDYCEQLDDFLSDDYEHWCRHALEGAYDWIDSLRRQAEDEAAAGVNLSSASPNSTEEAQPEATEELLLSKLSSDEAEDEVALLEITVKRPAITPAELQSLVSEYATPTARTEQGLPETGEGVAFQADPGSDEDGNIASDSEHELLPGSQEYITPEVATSEEDSSTTIDEQPVMQEFASADETITIEDRNDDSGEPALQEFALAGETFPAEDREAGGEEQSLQEFAPARESSQTEAKDAGSAEPPLQEFTSPEEIHPSQDGDAGIEEPVIQEFIATAEPAPAEQEAHFDTEEPVIQDDVSQELAIREGNDGATADPEQTKGPVEHEEARQDGNDFIPVQAVTTEESPATPRPSVPQWEWTAPPEANSTENPADTQEDEPERRSNFLWRLLAKIWGR